MVGCSGRPRRWVRPAPLGLADQGWQGLYGTRYATASGGDCLVGSTREESEKNTPLCSLRTDSLLSE